MTSKLKGKHSYLITVQCDPATTCSGHGTCTEDGSCKCSVGFYGDTCSSKSITLTPYSFTLDFWKIEFDELDFLSFLNLIFAACAACKNWVQTRKKIQFIKLNNCKNKAQIDRGRYRNVQIGCVDRKAL